MDTCNANVINGFHFIAHYLGCDLRFFGDRDIAGAGANHRQLPFAPNGAIAPNSHGAGKRKVLSIRKISLQQ